MRRSWRNFLAFCSEAIGWAGGLLILAAVSTWRALAEQMDEDDRTPGAGR